jgi:hypothetical protein
MLKLTSLKWILSKWSHSNNIQSRAHEHIQQLLQLTLKSTQVLPGDESRASFQNMSLVALILKSRLQFYKCCNNETIKVLLQIFLL